MTTLVIGSGLIGSQVARILVERGEKPVLMDHAAQPQAIGQIVDLGKVTMVAGDVLRPLSIVDVLRTHGITRFYGGKNLVRALRERGWPVPDDVAADQPADVSGSGGG